MGPDIRRGVSDLDGKGERSPASSSCARERTPWRSLRPSRQKIREIEPGLPAGVKIVPVYDRSELINRSIDNLKGTLIEVS